MKTLGALMMAAAIAAMGCGKKSEDAPAKTGAPEGETAKPETAKPETAKPETAKPETAKPETAKPETPGPAESPEGKACAALLDKAWPHVEAVLVKLEVENAAGLADTYKQSGKNFIERCAALDETQRACLAAADNPVVGLDTCQINKGKQASQKVFAVDMKSHIKLAEPADVTAEDASAVVAELAGTWKSTWAAVKTNTTWVVADGKAAIETVANGKPPETKTASLELVKDRRLKLTIGTSSQPYAFYRDGNKTFYLASNLLYDAYPVPDAKSFKLRNDWDYITFDKGNCEALKSTGVATKATCTFGKKDGKKTFEVSYQYEGEVWNTGKPAIKERTYFVVGDHFLHESLVAVGTFKKK